MELARATASGRPAISDEIPTIGTLQKCVQND